MSFKNLLTAIEAGETEKAMELAKTLEKDFKENISEISNLENKAGEAIATRNKAKAKLRTLAEAVGVDELTVETLSDLKASRGSDTEIEAKYKGQLDTLAGRIKEVESEYEEKLSEKTSLYNNVIIDRELLKIGVSANAASDAALEDIVRHLKHNVVIEDGSIVYKNSEGIPERSEQGRPLTLDDKLEALKQTRGYLFKPQGQGGSGEPHSQGGGSKSFKDMNETERIALYKRNPEEYRRLSQQ